MSSCLLETLSLSRSRTCILFTMNKQKRGCWRQRREMEIEDMGFADLQQWRQQPPTPFIVCSAANGLPQMSGIQGIIVCGEASESDEEEEFCAARDLGHRVNEARRSPCPSGEPRLDIGGRPTIHSLPQQPKKVATSLLHQKLWDTNRSLERNLAKAFREPLAHKTAHVSALTASLPAAQTSTFAANAAFAQVTSNLSRIDLMLQGLKHINAFDTLKSPTT